MKNTDKNSRLVYSTEVGKICPLCGKPTAACTCKKKKKSTSKTKEAVVNLDGKIRVQRSTKGRKGKGVCLISGLTLDETHLKDLAKKLKQKCGTGGTVKNGVIEIQGDHRDYLVEELNRLGYKAKRAGG